MLDCSKMDSMLFASEQIGSRFYYFWRDMIFYITPKVCFFITFGAI